MCSQNKILFPITMVRIFGWMRQFDDISYFSFSDEYFEILQDHEFKCFFCTFLKFSKVICYLYQAYATFQTFGEEVVIAGGLVESVFHQGKLYNKGISGLLFAGNLSATLIVHKTKRNQNDFIEKDKDQFFENLRTLKASVSHHQFNVIFMYACVARGHDLYSEQNVQTKWISEVMPGIPVIGMFAFGEIGYFGTRTMNDISKSSYSYSTVLCLCQF